MVQMVNSATKFNYSVRRRSQTTVLLVVMLVGIAWILFGFNTFNADYVNYEASYTATAKNGVGDSYFEIGFRSIILLSAALGLSYQGFLIVVSILSLSLFTLAVSKLTNNIVPVLVCYLIYPFLFDIVQYRNFLAFSFVLYGLHYLLYRKPKIKHAAKYIVFVVIGSLFHSSMIVYLILLLALIKKPSRFIICVSVLFFGLFIVMYNKSLLTTALRVFGLSRFYRYEFDGSTSTFIQYFAVYLFFMILYSIKLSHLGRYKFANRKMKILMVISVTIPIILLSGTGARFFRNAFVIFYAFMLEKNPVRKPDIYFRDTMIFISLLAALVFIVIMQFADGLYHDTVLVPIFQNNWIFAR